MRESRYRLPHGLGRSDKCLPFHRAVSWVCFVLLLLSFTGPAWAQESASARVTATSLGSGLPFAFADFDGDHRPDLAYVQTGRSVLNSDAYWIDFRLSFRGPYSVRILAPPGGLRIEARDVNGDNAVDLVVSTAWFRQPVAILLNDGHGAFTPEKPATFPDAFRQNTSERFASQHLLAGRIDVLTQSPLVFYLATPLSAPLRETSFRLRSGRTVPSLYFRSSCGRAPPILG